IALGAIGILLGIRCAEACVEENIDVDSVAVLALTNAILARAVLVPSSSLHTLGGSLLACAPMLLFSYDASKDPAATALNAVWLALPVAISVVASHVIYELRQEVQEAKQFGQYTIEEKIGAGGMGEVYRASHSMLRRPTAIKLLRGNANGERQLARFEREVQLTSSLTHPNTIAIYDYGRTPDGTFYYAMEYLDGVNLEKLIKLDGAQDPARVIHILAQACASLDEAHRAGLIHRDIKPANIILCERGGQQDVVKVVDFGLVKDLESKMDDATISTVNTITGTPLYLSPESIRTPDHVDARSDLYALGAVGYYLVTGKHLFDSKSFMEICSHHLQTQPESPSKRLGKPVPEGLEAVLLRCLEKTPGERPQSAKALRELLLDLPEAHDWKERNARTWWKAHQAKIEDDRDEEALSSDSSPTASLRGDTAGPVSPVDVTADELPPSATH
ncbi:MAG: serine/threonine-protein kinase, partial [Planctomycetota bacterium]